ncbi:MAG: 4Fe-4S dicluster domain-containing protein, partial [Candidatus Brocadiales bacterium]
DAVIEACPYENAIFYDDGSYFTLDVGAIEGNEGKGRPLQPYEEEINFQYGTDLKRKDLIGRPRKCDFCLHRLRSGMLPACVSTCVGGAMYFGDGNDPDSLVSELMRSNKVGRMAYPAAPVSSPTPGTAAPTTTATAIAAAAGTGGVAGVADVTAAQGTDPNVVYIAPEIPGGAMPGLKSCTPCHKMNVK